MKRCPACGRTFTNNTLINCLNDGTALVESVPAPPPYFGAPAAAAETPNFAEAPNLAEALPPAPPSEAPGTATYTDTPLSAIPELQSPEIQAALKEALDKAGMSGLLQAGSAHSTISVTTSTTGTSSFQAGGLPAAFTGAPPAPSIAAAPRRKRSPWGGLLFWLLLLLAAAFVFRSLHHKANMPAGGKPDAPAILLRDF